METEKEQKNNGNLGLPFGLCKKYGITLPKNATPYDAWAALYRKTGKKPETFYAQAKKEQSQRGQQQYSQSESGTQLQKKPVDKKTQLAIVQATNPAPNSYLTWIRSESDIKSADEVYKDALSDNDDKTDARLTDDFSLRDWEKALKTGKIKVYSSYPIKNGTFVTPSAQEASQYAGDKKLYSAEIDLADVAWIDALQGQFAKPNGKDENSPSKAVAEQDKTTKKVTVETPNRVREIRGDKYISGNNQYDIVQSLPNGWVVDTMAKTAPVGYKWIHNGKSYFSGQRKTALMKI